MIYAFLPFASAALYGLGYILMERMLKTVPILAYMTINSLLFTAILVTLFFLNRNETTLSFLSDKKVLLLFLITLAVNATAWVMTLLSLKNNSATYTAFAEISYPLFVVLFLFLIFGIRQWNWMTLLGGAIIFAGSLLIVAAQVKTGKS